VYLAFTGSGGTPLHFGSLISYQSTSHFRRMMPVYMSAGKSLQAARVVMSKRCDKMRSLGKKSAASLFPNVDPSLLDRISTGFKAKLDGASSIEELLGFEGQYARQSYAVMATLAGVEVENGQSAFKRLPGNASTNEDRFRLVNAMIDHGNYLAYGVAGAALWALGIPPHMSIFHGKTRAGGLVFDLADAFKDSLVLPLAFHHGFSDVGADAEKEFRSNIIDLIDDENMLSYAIEVVDALLDAGESDA
jgi:CRISPR-associated protein Cas1